MDDFDAGTSATNPTAAGLEDHWFLVRAWSALLPSLPYWFLWPFPDLSNQVFRYLFFGACLLWLVFGFRMARSYGAMQSWKFWGAGLLWLILGVLYFAITFLTIAIICLCRFGLDGTQ